MKNTSESEYKRHIFIDQRPYPSKVVYNPDAKHWYLDTHSIPMDSFPTKHGKVDPKSLTKTMMATDFFAINIEHFTSYDVCLMKDNQGRIAVFTMVQTDQEFGNFYRTDHKGFGYKTVHFYIDTKAYHRYPGAQHYLTTEDLAGKWSLVCVLHPQDFIRGAYNEFTNRHCLAKGFNSEAEVLDYFKNELNVADLRDTEQFVYLDPSTPIDEELL